LWTNPLHFFNLMANMYLHAKLLYYQHN
jgi:hypothetical protein